MCACVCFGCGLFVAALPGVLYLQSKCMLWQDGSADEGLMLELASQLSEKFDVESLSMYDALQEVWSNANKCTYNPVASMPKAKVRREEGRG